ncbi:MAG: DUF2490 domain-containing protein [Chryseolinea sp.]
MKKYLVLCLLAMAVSARAQEKVHHQTLYWIYYTNQLYFKPNLYWVNNVDNRRFMNPDQENQFICHSRLHYKKGKWDFGAGLTLSSIYTQIPENGSSHIATELRPVIETSHETPIGKVSLQNRVRLDNRFLETSTQESVLDTSIYVLRFRYRLQARMPLVKDKDNNTVLQLRVSDEIMLNHKENLFDQNRINVTIDYILNKNFTFELGYIYIYQQRYSKDEFYSRNTIRFGLQHKIMLKSKKE